MKRRLLFLALAIAATPAIGEVSVDHPAGGGVSLYFEPADSGPWARVRPATVTGDMLNPQGDFRSDGWPAWAVRANGQPSIVWATTGDESEINLSWHDGVSWRPSWNISHRSGADSGPTITLDQYNNRFVAWNNARGSRLAVLFTGVRSDGAAQQGVAELTARQREGRKPSLGAFGEDVYVAYEEQYNGNDDVPYVAIDRVTPNRQSDHVLMCSGENTPDFSRSATIRTCLTDRNMVGEVTVHVESGNLWVTWLHSRTLVGWVELQTPGVFTAPSYRPYDQALGPAPALSQIRDQVLAP